MLSALKDGAAVSLAVQPQRYVGVAAAQFENDVASRIRQEIEPALERGLALLDDEYWDQAPEEVGLSQYMNGHDIYAGLVKLNTTLDLTPQQVHAIGVARMTKIQFEMRSIRADLGHGDDTPGFLAKINADPRWRATTITGVAAVFQRYIDRLAQRFAEFFAAPPAVEYGVAPLPEALQSSMTFGY